MSCCLSTRDEDKCKETQCSLLEIHCRALVSDIKTLRVKISSEMTNIFGYMMISRESNQSHTCIHGPSSAHSHHQIQSLNHKPGPELLLLHHSHGQGHLHRAPNSSCQNQNAWQSVGEVSVGHKGNRMSFRASTPIYRLTSRDGWNVSRTQSVSHPPISLYHSLYFVTFSQKSFIITV